MKARAFALTLMLTLAILISLSTVTPTSASTYTTGGSIPYTQFSPMLYILKNETKTSPPLSVALEYTAVNLSFLRPLHPLLAFYFGYDPIYVSTNASSWSLVHCSYKTYNLSGYPLGITGTFGVFQDPPTELYIYFLAPPYTAEFWYMNVTLTFNVTYSTTHALLNVTVPVYFAECAQYAVIPEPNASYPAGKLVSFNATIGSNMPSGYYVASPLEVFMSIQGAGINNRQLNFTTAFMTPVTTTYTWTIQAEDYGYTLFTQTGTFTVVAPPIQHYIVAEYEDNVSYGSSIPVMFETVQGLPYYNMTGLGLFTDNWFINRTVQMLLNLSSLNGYFALLTSPSSSPYAIGFTNSPVYSSAITYYFNATGSGFHLGVNNMTLYWNGTKLLLFVNGVKHIVSNTTPINGVLIDKPGEWWFYEYGAVYPEPASTQSYVVLIGQSPKSLSQVTSGYTNSSGFAFVSVPANYYPNEIVDVYWYGVTNLMFNVTVGKPTGAPSGYNATPINSAKPLSSVYDFSAYQPWASIIGLAVVAVVTILGWKFGGTAGVAGGAIAGLILVSYLGLLPWFAYIIALVGVIMLIAKTFTDKFMGSDEM
ncbi:putative end-filament protein [Sulfolobales Mexican fusellovirus 1]|uniref:end-filament protein n=1 Tax=Sulfolobales Mexican fusellovirus 1 TaxID=1298531 RepID=UPI0002C0632E|nr:end-filament protein [Sulfolobales Mexican fusellovirus 1]AGG36565.1 putative end-filament protein [Sulfolobales Mexican fusellovirus 1]